MVEDTNGISILGSTGSIGRQSLEVAEHLGVRVRAITGNRNVKLLEEQARRFRPELVAVRDEALAKDAAVRLADTGVRVAAGERGLIEAAQLPTETLISALVGTAGLAPTMAAVKCGGRRIALANKETLVCAGRLFTAAVKECGDELVPVDSEHSAIFQCLRCGSHAELRRILLTASGGPFLNVPKEELLGMTKERALKNPNWSMGAKLTIDSATMMNKGLEIIEAMNLFSVEPEAVRVIVHPQSIVHSMVEFCDSAVIAQLGVPDMRLPIQFALTYPNRVPSLSAQLDLTKLGTLTFLEPDLGKFRCLALAMEVAGRRDAAPAVMNAANETAVMLYLEDRIGFLDIFDKVAGAVDALGAAPAGTIGEVLAADRAAREFVLR